MLLALKITGFILLSLLAVLIAVLIAPLTLHVRYADGVFTVRLWVLFVRVTLFPTKSREKKCRRAARGEKKKEAGRAKRKPKTEAQAAPKQNLFSAVKPKRDLIPPAAAYIKKVLRHIRIRQVKLRIIAGSGSGAEAGLAAGRVYAAVCAGKTVVEQVTRVGYSSVKVIPDFTGEQREKGEYGCKITAIPIILVADTLVFLLRILRIARRSKG